MVITNHPKMIKMWADRCLHIITKEGHDKAKIWARQFFKPEQIKLINTEMLSRKGMPRYEGTT